MCVAKSHVRFTPMCGRLRIGKDFSSRLQHWSVRPGKPLLGIEPQRRKVWYWNGEDPAEENARAFAALRVHRSFRLGVANELHISLEMTGMDAILPTLFARKWTIFVSPEDSAGFITCDNPVALMFTDPAMRGGLYGAGHELTGTELVFPVSNRLALVGTFEGSDAKINVSEETVASVNGCMVAYCDRQVYAPDSEFTYLLQYGEIPRSGAALLNDVRFVANRKRKGGARTEDEQKL